MTTNELTLEFKNHLIYYNSLGLVAPILDSLGMESGIKKIYSKKYPSKEEIVCPELYHKRILK